MSIVKKLLYTLLFVLLAMVVPGVIVLLTLDATKSFSTIIIIYSFILFATLGFILVSTISMSKEVKDAVEAMKKQNAAIAYKLTGGADELLKGLTDKTENNNEPNEEAKEKIDTSKVNLNPETPLEIKVKQETKTTEKTKVVSNDFNDFK